MDRWLNQIICGDNVAVMRQMPDRCIDLTVTSPPYDNLRTYNGFSFNFEEVAQELYRITKDGGVVVWVVGDATIKGSETGTSFKQALFFKDIGFNLHDTMIYKRHSPNPPNIRYWQTFEYMFVLSKGKPKTFNLLTQKKTRHAGFKKQTIRRKDGTIETLEGNAKERIINAQQSAERIRDNVWEISSGYGRSSKDSIAYQHPAIFPEQLANDHIISWSNIGDVVLDPMCGSGTTCKMAKLTGRNFIGIDISEEYCEIARRRVEQAQAQQSLFGTM